MSKKKSWFDHDFQTEVSRRRMLTGLGIGGASLLLGSHADAHSGRRTSRGRGRGRGRGHGHGRGRSQRGEHVLILGAGIAGLSAAYELSRAGYRVTIVESSNRIGGRIHTIRRG